MKITIYYIIFINFVSFFVVSPSGTIIIFPASFNTNFGSSQSLTCSAGGGPNNIFEWQRQGVIVSNNSILEFQSITGSDGGLYQCIATNAAGSDSQTILITGTYVASYVCVCTYYSQLQ